MMIHGTDDLFTRDLQCLACLAFDRCRARLYPVTYFLVNDLVFIAALRPIVADDRRCREVVLPSL